MQGKHPSCCTITLVPQTTNFLCVGGGIGPLLVVFRAYFLALCSGIIPGRLGEHMACQELNWNWGWLHAKQKPYPLCYHSGPTFLIRTWAPFEMINLKEVQRRKLRGREGIPQKLSSSQQKQVRTGLDSRVPKTPL